MNAYRIAVAGRLPAAAWRMLSELGATASDLAGPVSTVEVIDQAALVGLLNRMHSLGLVIDHVERVERRVE